jgi:monofunctional biosynthetic peptidoglycan transglycosylase
MFKVFLIWTWRCIAAWFVGTIVLVAVLRVVPPAVTPLMLQRLVTAPFTGRSLLVVHRWISWSDLDKDIARAVQAGEDGRFMSHNGIDWKAVENAQRVNPRRVKRGKPPLGASTITMQTAKNVFLLPIRSIIRKGAEAYFTYLIEYLWGKKRILEVYVNMIEWGDGYYGIEAATQRVFKHSANELSVQEASRLAAVVPNPRRFDAANPSGYVKRRQAWVRGRMDGMRVPN